jgi:hypothetical protein
MGSEKQQAVGRIEESLKMKAKVRERLKKSQIQNRI